MRGVLVHSIDLSNLNARNLGPIKRIIFNNPRRGISKGSALNIDSSPNENVDTWTKELNRPRMIGRIH